MLRTRTPIGAVLLTLVLTGCGSTVQPGTQTVSGGQPGGTSGSGSTGGLGAPTSGSQGLPGTGGTGGTATGPGAGGTTTGAGTTGGSTTGGAASGTAGANTTGTSGPSSTQPKTGPLQLGVLDAKSPAAAASATGAKSPAGVDPAELTRAFIHYYNAHGGLAGRKLEPIEYTIDPTSASYENDLSAACAKFTQDNHVRLVVSQTGNIFSGNYEGCLTKAGATNLEVGNGAPDERSLKSYPRLYTTGSPTVDRRVTAQLRGLAKTGLLTRTTKIGVIVEACPDNTRAYDKTVVPVARSLGLTLERRDVDCVAGFNDAGNFFAQVGSAVLPYKTAGVSRVLFMTSFEVAAVQAFENQAQAQAYTPSYVLSSIAATPVQASQYSADAQKRMFGVGWIPVQDTTGIPQGQAVKRCFEIASAEGQSIASQGDYVFLLQICDLFGILDAALVNASGSDDTAAFAAGLGAASKSFQSTDILGGRLRLGGDTHDAPPVFAPFGYVGSCSCFRYLGKPAALA
ncbi:MAG: hypothetical protein QOJ79_1666 [Actinomycetota bacterium]|jgi:hypothetical protein|nr:hypothetical protein [Actinomycetota bacterium]